MKRMISEGDVLTLSGELMVCVYRNDCAAKVVPLNKRDWKAPDFEIDISEPGHRISAGACVNEPGGSLQLVGRLRDSQLKQPIKKIMIGPKVDLGHVMVPMPGTAPKKKRHAPVEKVEIADHFPEPVVTPIPAGKINEVVLAMKQGAAVFANLITSRTVSPGA